MTAVKMPPPLVEPLRWVARPTSNTKPSTHRPTAQTTCVRLIARRTPITAAPHIARNDREIREYIARPERPNNTRPH